MNQISRRGIYYNLSLSPFNITIDDITFYFSSKLHFQKFTERVNQFKEYTKTRMEKKVKVKCEINQLIVLMLYETIETRGFYIKLNGDEIDCLTKLTFVGSLEKKTS